MVLGKLPVPGRPTIWITVGQGPIALAVDAGGGCLDIFILIYPEILSQRAVKPKTTNQPTSMLIFTHRPVQFAGPRSAIGRAPDS